MQKFFIPSSSRVPVMVALCDLFILTIYVWLISFGTWLRWPVTSTYYDQLATAFEHRSLSLETKPSQALLALSDPYDPAERAGISFLKDASLYNGRYYLYFGPIPALILAVFKLMGLGRLGDQYLVFVFVSGILIFQSMLIFKVWKLFFQNVPVWILSLCILFGGLISPLTWILTQPRIYEAAASSGQFFFLGGFYFAITALEQKTAANKYFLLLIGGIAWMLAIGSRLTQILPIGFVILIIAFLLIEAHRPNNGLSKVILAIEFLCGPIILGVAVLARYNWTRFHSVFESGLSYQLAGLDLHGNGRVLFSPLYILPNLYGYLVMPPQINRTFPFLLSIPGNGISVFPFITLPQIYYNNVLTGLLLSTPFILFAGVCVISVMLKKKDLMGLVAQADDLHLFRWLVVALSGAFLFGFVPFIFFFWVAAHYQLDFVPSLVILSILGFWWGYIFTTHKTELVRKAYAFIGIILIVTSIIISILLVLSAHADKFQKFNPVPWDFLTRLFSH
jgi:hypothetical protein